jgi:hypothetical protein
MTEYRLLPRVVGICLLAAALIPIYYFCTRYVNAITLYPGDVLEKRSCRWCAGTGKDEEMARQIPEFGERCPACRGSGEVQVVVPGPERPTRVHGAVRIRFGDDDELYEAPEEMPHAMNSRLLMPLRGGIAEAAVAFRALDANNQDIVLKTNGNGRYLAFLPPGAYRLFVQAQGYEPHEEEFEVPPLTEPIWFEHAQCLEEAESPADQASRYGIVHTVRMNTRGS